MVWINVSCTKFYLIVFSNTFSHIGIADKIVLSPPVVKDPIYECAEAVHVTGFDPHNDVKVYAGTELVGQATPLLGLIDIQLNRPLELGEMITATQGYSLEPGVDTVSLPSLVPVIVQQYETPVDIPTVVEDVYECGRVVRLWDLTESSQVTVFGDGDQIGHANAARSRMGVTTRALEEDEEITATQTACTEESDISDAVSVQPEPTSIPSPKITEAVLGNDSVMVGDLLIGSKITIYDGDEVIRSSYATAKGCRCPISQEITSSSSITVTQELCGSPSDSSEPAEITDTLTTPLLLAPIYDGQQFVMFRNTLPNAVVKAESVGLSENIGNGSGTPAGNGAALLALDRAVTVGEIIVVKQFVGSVSSPPSNQVVVGDAASNLILDILEGESFFIAEGRDGEQQIDGSVYPRGRGEGPLVRVTTEACSQGIDVRVSGPTGTVITFIENEKYFPGFYSFRWDWSSDQGWIVPDEIPVGEYTIDVTNRCNSSSAGSKFYVIFDPKEVDGPDRFSFNEIGVWFSARTYSTHGISYQLHPDDFRVFSEAINAINGLTNQQEASDHLLSHEAAMFGYSLAGHGKDVLPLLTADVDEYFYDDDGDLFLECHGRCAQCSDDANWLVALMRSVGIPSHPVTADAALEQDIASWKFDTWVEAKFVGDFGLRWYPMHPHENLEITTRHEAGNLWSVASKQDNDIIIMANTSWISEELDDHYQDYLEGRDVAFHLDESTSCHEPAETFDYKAEWIDHLCIYPEYQGYWSEGHWECSPGWSSDIAIDILDAYRVGDTIEIDVYVDNTTTSDKEGTLDVNIAIDDTMSKYFPDGGKSSVGVMSVVIPSNSTALFTFSFGLPIDLTSAYEYTVMVDLDYDDPVHDDDANMKAFGVSALYIASLDLPADLQSCSPGVDCSFEADLIIENVSSEAINGFELDARLPFGVQTLGGGKQVTLYENEILPFETVVKTLNLKIVEPNEVANFIVYIESDNGGLATISRSVEIQTIDELDFAPNDAPLTVPCTKGTMSGNHSIYNLDDLIELSGYTAVEGQIRVHWSYDETDLRGLECLESVGDDLHIKYTDNLLSLQGLSNLIYVGDDLEIEHNDMLLTLDGLDSLTDVGGELIIHDNLALENLSGIDTLTNVGDKVEIQRNPVLTSLLGLGSLSSVLGDMEIDDNDWLDSLAGLDSLHVVEGNLEIEQNNSLVTLLGLEAITSIEGDLEIKYNDVLENVDGLNNLTSIWGDIHVHGNQSLGNLDDLMFVTYLGDDLRIHNNDVLPTCEAEQLEDHLIAQGWTEDADISGNDDNGVCN